MSIDAIAPQGHDDPVMLALTSLAPGRWGTHLASADAALLAAVGVRAVVADTGDNDPLTVTTHYVSAVVAGAVEITVGHIDRAGGRTTADATVHQHGRVVARLLVTSVTQPSNTQEGS